MHKKKSGFTLIEVLISIAILGILISPVLEMVFTTVKVNKDAEDKQKALNIAQQVIEEAKACNPLSVEDVSYDKDGFNVTKKVSQLEEYDFNQHSDKKADDIHYDAKVEISYKELSNIISVYDSENFQKYTNVLCDENNKIEIVNDAGKIAVNLNDKKLVDINKSGSDKKSGEVFIKFDKDAKNSFDIRTVNDCSDDELIMFFGKEKGAEAQYSFSNEKGRVKSYYNVMISDSSCNVGRVFKIEIKVSKNGKVLQSMTAYKTAAE